MLNREDWLMIREMREKGCYLREIAERVGYSERTVRRAPDTSTGAAHPHHERKSRCQSRVVALPEYPAVHCMNIFQREFMH